MTLLGGGTKESSQSFDKAVEVGNKKLEEAVKEGSILFIHAGELKKKGVTPPELPSLPADILQKWNIKKSETQAKPQSQTTASLYEWVRWTHPQNHYSFFIS